MAAPDVAPILVPDDFTVWAASDLHGQLRAVDRLLDAAGLTDGADRWIAPPRTALVVTGDVVDRGPDSVGLVRRLVGLRARALAAGGCVALIEGNHEVQVLGGLAGDPHVFRALLSAGGGATLLSAGLRPGEWDGLTEAEIAARVNDLVPDLRPALATFAPFARWRDLLFVHGGPVPFQAFDEFGRGTDRLWIRDRFYASPDPFPGADAWASYREAGIDGVVFGHTPMDRPTFFHDGHALNLDTWRGQQVTLAKLEPGRALAEAVFIAAPAEPRLSVYALVREAGTRESDAAMPAVVGESHRGCPLV